MAKFVQLSELVFERARIENLVPSILKWEGGYVNDPLDKGGCTNMGVTIGSYRHYIDSKGTCADLKKLTKDQFTLVFSKFWNRWKADQIMDQQVANILVDWVFNSGTYGIRIPQRILGIKQDGIVGPITLAAVNAQNPKDFHAKIWAAREKFYHDIVRNNPRQKRFLKGWLNRLNDYKWK